MTCQEHWETLSAALDDEPTPGKRTAAEQHRASCPECQARQAAAQALRTGLQTAAHSRAADPIRDEAILAALRSEDWCGKASPSAQSRGGTEAQRGTRGRLWPPSLVAQLRWRGGTLYSLVPALVVLATAFLLTWAPLHMAESGRLSGPTVAAIPTAQPKPVGAAPPLIAWLRQPAVIAAILQGQPLGTWERRRAKAQPSLPAAHEPQNHQGALPRNGQPVG